MILQGELKHPFFPEPSELRLVCEKAMAPVREAMRDEARRREMERQRREHLPPPDRTPEEIERHKRLMARFHENIKTDKDRRLDAERAELRARYGMTDEVLSKIKDAPIDGARIGDVNHVQD